MDITTHLNDLEKNRIKTKRKRLPACIIYLILAGVFCRVCLHFRDISDNFPVAWGVVVT